LEPKSNESTNSTTSAYSLYYRPILPQPLANVNAALGTDFIKILEKSPKIFHKNRTIFSHKVSLLPSFQEQIHQNRPFYEMVM
jgi:hypothetical protein